VHAGRRSNPACSRVGPTVDRAREDIKRTIGLVRVEAGWRAGKRVPDGIIGGVEGCCGVLPNGPINSLIKCGRGRGLKNSGDI